jgi:SlyX protein
LLDELNEVVTECNLRIDQLNRENMRLRESINGLQPSMEESPDE